MSQGPPGPPGALGNPGLRGEGFPGPKVSQVVDHVLTANSKYVVSPAAAFESYSSLIMLKNV